MKDDDITSLFIFLLVILLALGAIVLISTFIL
jgi:hypothetical protein